MMDKKFWFTVLLSIATVWGIQWYFGRNLQQQSPASGPVAVNAQQQGVPNQPVKVLSVQDFYRPLNTKVALGNEQEPTELTTLETPYLKATFTNQGGALATLSYKEHKAKGGSLLASVNDFGVANVEAKQKACFLLAMDGQTPFIYKKVSATTDDKQQAKITYQAETSQWIIEKTYTLPHHAYKVDLTVSVFPKQIGEKLGRMRLFVPAPMVKDLADDTLGIISLNKAKNSIEKVELDKSEGLAWPWDSKNTLFGAENKYFAHVLVSDAAQFVQRTYVKQVTLPAAKPSDTPQKELYAIFESAPVVEKQSWTMSFYMGPKALEHLSAVDDRLEDLMDFGMWSWLCKMLLKLLEYLYSFLNNYGLAILALALALRIPLIPLSVYSRRKMEIYQKFQPTIQKIRLKYRHDMKMQHEELMKFHQEHNLSTATPVLGCLPMLIQLPILFALFRVLGNYISLYNAPFYGWVVDLSAKDPYYVLPILMGGSMIWQQLMTPTTDEKQRVIMLFMSLVFTVFFAKAAAGLVLYWLVNNIVTVGEDYLRKLVYR